MLNVLDDSDCHFFARHTLNGTLGLVRAGWSLINPGRPVHCRDRGRGSFLVSDHGGANTGQHSFSVFHLTASTKDLRWLQTKI